MDSNYSLLVSKINDFTKKFYLNKLLRGSIYAAAVILALFLILFVLTYYLNPGVGIKTFLFFAFVVADVLMIAFWIVKPSLLYFNLRKTLTIEESATLIGNHFFNVQDKLLNTLQLKALADQNPQNSSLILAGIDQKINDLKPIPFASAIRLGDNRKYVRFVIIPLSIILFIGILAPSVLREGSSSFVQYNKEILPVAPFNFNVVNRTMRYSQGDDATISVKLTGDQIPQEVYISDGVNSYKLDKKDRINFSYTFKNIQNDKKIQFYAGGFNSATYTIEVKAKPSISGLTAQLKYPAYLNKSAETVQNAGDLLLPEGTTVTWKINTENSSGLTFAIGNHTESLRPANNTYSVTKIIKTDVAYMFTPENQFSSGKDAIRHQISTIKDEFPSVSAEEKPDSISTRVRYFSGKIADDHGFSSLAFIINVKENGLVKSVTKKYIPVKKNQLENQFFFVWNANNDALKGGQTLEYYFQVWDNDGVNGAKSTKSDIRIFEVPTAQQINDQLNEGSKSLKQQMEKAIKLAGEVEKETKKLGENLLDKKQLTFEDKKLVEQLLDKQKQLDEAVKNIKQQNEKNTFQKEENNAINDELAEKQKKIDELFNNVLDEKTKDLLKKLQDLMDQNNKDQTRNELSKMQMDNKSLKNELDRILELYKQLEFEQNLQNNIDQLKALAKEQKELGKKSEDKESKAGDLKAQQEKLADDFQKLKEDLEKVAQKNEQLERPNNFENPKEESKEVSRQQESSKDKLDKGDKKAASKDQQKAGEQMEKMAKKMEEMQQQSSETEAKVNAQELRQLLENLLKTSFDQEKVMLALKTMNANDPLYTANVQKQRGIKDNLKTIADSLFALSKRVPQIESVVNEEMQKINLNVDKGLENLGERNTASANRNQQYAMTSINNLSLMLSEALDQLQKAQKNPQSGKGQKGSMKQLQQMQQQLNNSMQKAREQMQRDGNNGKVPKGQMSQEFSKMAQQQQMIREAMQKLSREQNKEGKNGAGDLSKSIEDMKATENDLVNKRIEQQTLDRQKKILDKMLDAEKAEREEEEDERREAKSAKDFPPSYKQMLDKFKNAQQSESEWLQKLPPDLNYYYKNKVAEYFKLLNSPKK
ncbi:MAG: hypothetical protein V4687_13095 [Bacteroidota bacterium]